MNERFYERMKELLGDEYEAYLSELERPMRRGLRINPLRIDEDAFFRLTDYRTEKSPFAGHGYYFDSEETVGGTFPYTAGLFYMQEPSASAAVTVLDPKPGMKVLDLCAAPGSKTTQILEMMDHDGLVVANEYDRKRAQILPENIEKCGASNCMIINADTSVIADTWPEYFDAVLCDAPCSGEGMFRKEQAAVDQWSEEYVLQCAARQKEIIENAYRCLRPGGILVYSTCTLNLEENEYVIRDFTDRHPDMQICRKEVPFGRNGFPTEAATDQCIRIFPMDGGEGHFIARLRKDGDDRSTAETLPDTKLPAFVREALEDILEKQYPHYLIANDRVYGGTQPFLKPGKCRLLRNQVLLGEIRKNRFEPSHHLFMSAYSPFRNTVELDDDEIRKYMHGEQISKHCRKGWAAVTWNGYVIGGAKSDGNVLKNRYPKHLRTR